PAAIRGARAAPDVRRVRKPRVIIDCHGHYTTAPAQLAAWRERKVAGVGDRAGAPDPAELVISAEEIRESIEGSQLRLMDDRGTDVTLFSPPAAFMANPVGDLEVSWTWARTCNDLVHRVSALLAERSAMGAVLPQSPGVDP